MLRLKDRFWFGSADVGVFAAAQALLGSAQKGGILREGVWGSGP
jgi:hypothetical protein